MRAIGHVEGAREKLEDDYWGGQESCIILSEELPPEALQGIESFSHVEVLFLFDCVDESKVVLGARLYVGELDAVVGTPVLDLKPIMAEFLPREETRQPDWTRELMTHYWERKA